MARTYSNPIVTGFFPDPSIIRVGEDYYMVNSTFEYFPAVVISHSKDLVHWEIIGHAITRSDYIDLTGIEDSHGFWAPDISFYNGTFYIMATLRLNNRDESGLRSRIRRQVVVKSDRPEGPYSKPVFIDVDGIDPSHFVDDDGTHYMVLSPGASIVKLNDECTKALSPKITVWPGTGERAPEGPHILKKDGYYYAILAEGGTGYGHRITVARSRSLFGPYEPSPYNPVMMQTDPTAPIQRTGHGKLVQTQNGDWWIAYLCGRPNQGRYTTLGRETALDPVEWTEDGWFMVNKGRGPSLTQVAPDLPETKYEEKYFDDFDGVDLQLYWQFVRNPDNDGWSLTDRPGYLRIYTSNGQIGQIETRNIIVRREKHFAYKAAAKLEFNPGCAEEEAGLICMYGRHCSARIFMSKDEGSGNFKVRVVEVRNDVATRLGESEAFSVPVVYLRITVDRQVRRFYYSLDNLNWIFVAAVEDATFLSDEGVRIGKHHTGTMVGMYAVNNGTGGRTPADFDWFDYQFE